MSELFVLEEVKSGNDLMTSMTQETCVIWAECRIMSKRISKSRLNRQGIPSTNTYNTVYSSYLIKNSFAGSFKKKKFCGLLVLSIDDRCVLKILHYFSLYFCLNLFLNI